jgi:hypothetical protein
MKMAKKSDFEKITDAITGKTHTGENTFDALNKLNAKLQRLKELSPAFDRIEFSPAIQKLHAEAHVTAAL